MYERDVGGTGVQTPRPTAASVRARARSRRCRKQWTTLFTVKWAAVKPASTRTQSGDAELAAVQKPAAMRSTS